MVTAGPAGRRGWPGRPSGRRPPRLARGYGWSSGSAGVKSLRCWNRSGRPSCPRRSPAPSCSRRCQTPRGPRRPPRSPPTACPGSCRSARGTVLPTRSAGTQCPRSARPSCGPLPCCTRRGLGPGSGPRPGPGSPGWPRPGTVDSPLVVVADEVPAEQVDRTPWKSTRKSPRVSASATARGRRPSRSRPGCKWRGSRARCRERSARAFQPPGGCLGSSNARASRTPAGAER